MLGHLANLEKRLIDMLAVIEAKTMDYRFALVSFHSVYEEPRVNFHQWTFDYLSIENAFQDMRVESGNNIGSRVWTRRCHKRFETSWISGRRS